jgi:hypothetical protein
MKSSNNILVVALSRLSYQQTYLLECAFSRERQVSQRLCFSMEVKSHFAITFASCMWGNIFKKDFNNECTGAWTDEDWKCFPIKIERNNNSPMLRCWSRRAYILHRLCYEPDELHFHRAYQSLPFLIILQCFFCCF